MASGHLDWQAIPVQLYEDLCGFLCSHMMIIVVHSVLQIFSDSLARISTRRLDSLLINAFNLDFQTF